MIKSLTVLLAALALVLYSCTTPIDAIPAAPTSTTARVVSGRKKSEPDIIEFTRDILGITLSPAQEVILRALYGLPLVGAEQLRLFKEMTGLKRYPARPFSNAVVAISVRGGKTTRVLVPVTLYEAIYGQWRFSHKPGDQYPVFALVAQNLRGVTGAAFAVLAQVLRDAPGLQGRYVIQKDVIKLQNGAQIIVLPNTTEAPAGLALQTAALDEVARWAGPGKVNDAEELHAAYQTRLFGLDGAKLILASSFFVNDGLFYRLYKEGFGVPQKNRIVFRAPLRLMRPGPDTERELAEMQQLMSHAHFARDFLCEPSDRISRFLEEQLVLSTVDQGVRVRPYVVGVQYEAGLDVAGTGNDPFALAIGHWEDNKKVLDFTRVWPKGPKDTRDPYAVLDQMATDMKLYNVRLGFGDGFARGYPKWHLQQNHRVRYIECDESMLPDDLRGDKSRNYERIERDMLSSTIRLLDNQTLVDQLCNLEVELRDGGKRHIEAARNRHEDLADALGCLGVALEYQRRKNPRASTPWIPQPQRPQPHPDSLIERLRRAHSGGSYTITDWH